MSKNDKKKKVRKKAVRNTGSVVHVDECPQIHRQLLAFRSLWAAEKQGQRTGQSPDDVAMLSCLLDMSGRLSADRQYDPADFAGTYPTACDAAHAQMLDILYEANPAAVHLCVA